jgi:hypothetical protein
VGLEWWGEKSSVVFNSNCKLMRNAFVVVGKKNLNYASSRDKKEQMISYDYHQNSAKKNRQ